MEEFPSLPQAWQEWTIKTLLGKGSYGCVYEAERPAADQHEAGGKAGDGSSESELCAIKVLTFPYDETELAVRRRECGADSNIISYYENLTDNLMAEIRSLSVLSGHPNIASVRECIRTADHEQLRWQIFIRMELLTAFDDYFYDCGEEVTETAVRVGIDICEALKKCHSCGILHRDIKPDNILVDENGNFKLGDFGIARHMDRTDPFSMKGTYNYMAPEIYHGEACTERSDLYSLGIVLFRLLNRSRDPFVDIDKQLIYVRDRDRAAARRMSGEELPYPADAKDDLGDIIRKACAYSPEDRYPTAQALLDDLIRYRKHEKISFPSPKKKGKLSLSLRRRRIFIVLLAVALPAVIAAVLIFGKNEKQLRLEEIEKQEAEITSQVEPKNYELENWQINTKAGDDARAAFSENGFSEADAGDKAGDLKSCSYVSEDGQTALVEVISYELLEDAARDRYYIEESYDRTVCRKAADDEIGQEEKQQLKEKLYQLYLPEACLKAMSEGRRADVYSGFAWISSEAYFPDVLVSRLTASWIDESGNLCLALVFRNGTAYEHNIGTFWLEIRDDASDTIVRTAGNLGNVSVPAESVSGALLTIPAEELLKDSTAWGEEPEVFFETYNSDNSLYHGSSSGQ